MCGIILYLYVADRTNCYVRITCVLEYYLSKSIIEPAIVVMNP